MKSWKFIFCSLLIVTLNCNGQLLAENKEQEPQLQLLLSEVQPGGMSSEHHCMLVFGDRSFHAEKASLSRGKDENRKIYEGRLSSADWNTLDEILGGDQLRKLNVKPGYIPLVTQNVHSFTISVRREKGFQNMEFIDDNARKPYDSQLKPLLHWWKTTRGQRMAVSEAPADNRCSLDSSRGVFSY